MFQNPHSENEWKSESISVLRNSLLAVVSSPSYITDTLELYLMSLREELHGCHVEGSCDLSEGPVERSVPGCYTFSYCSSSTPACRAATYSPSSELM